MKWLTWENVGIDRMASAWLIRKLIDAEAEFIFVPVGTIPLPEGAEPFDIPGVPYSHHRGHCTFHALIKAHNLKDPIIRRIADIVDEADVVQEAVLEPAAFGLDLICRGVRRTSKDDGETLVRGAGIFEALYAELDAEISEDSGQPGH
jgi:hypothetical protein